LSARSTAAGEAPAPWSLTGRGYVVLLKPAADTSSVREFTPAPLADAPLSGPGLLMYVDYASSAVGRYRELLYMPGRFRFGGETRWSITRIVVSTEASVRAGRRNWGIPKELASFAVTTLDDGGERIEVHQDGQMLAALEFGRAGLRLPGGGALLPRSLRAMVQVHEGHCYRYAPSARGPLAWTRLRRLVTNADRFPELGPEQVLMACAAPDFSLGFPVASVSGIPDE